jgi:hypothetical protein
MDHRLVAKRKANDIPFIGLLTFQAGDRFSMWHLLLFQTLSPYI